jgi:hypothetical protein
MPILTLSNVQTGTSDFPARILLYAPGGIGKTKFGASAPSPIFIQTEDGLGNIDVPHFPLAKSWEEVEQAMAALYTEPHSYKTLIVDSLDWYENLIWNQVIKENPVNSKGKQVQDLVDLPYGEGYKLATAKWVEFLDKCNKLRMDKGMTIIFLAHDEIKKFDDPEKGTYNYYGPKLHKLAAEKVMEWVDITLFANYQVVLATEKGAFGGPDKVRVLGQNTRTVVTQERPSCMAKNRYNLPGEITIPEGDTNWNALWSQLAASVPNLKKLTNKQESK